MGDLIDLIRRSMPNGLAGASRYNSDSISIAVINS